MSVSRAMAMLAGVALAGMSALLIGYSSAPTPASANAGADAGVHGALVVETPITGWPRVLGTPTYFDEGAGFEQGDERVREVFAAARVGNTMVLGGNTVKVVSWYDNEWGYSQRVCDLIALSHGMN